MSMKQIITENSLGWRQAESLALEDAKKAFIEMLEVAVYHKSGKRSFDAPGWRARQPTSTYSWTGELQVAEATQKSDEGTDRNQIAV